MGTQKAYQLAALCFASSLSSFSSLPRVHLMSLFTALGKALVESKRPLVYGGGSRGIMGIISGAVLEGGGEVTGVLPYAMIAAGGEGDKSGGKGGTTEKSIHYVLNEVGSGKRWDNSVCSDCIA